MCHSLFSFSNSARFLLGFILLGCWMPESGAQGRRARQEGAKDALFKGGEVLKIQIEIPEKEFEILSKSQWTFGPQSKRDKVEVTVREGTQTWTQVSLHLKGAAGSFRSVQDKPGFTLNFDKNVEDQDFHGLEKLSLNNSVQDPTYVSEKLARELFLQAGVPAPRAAHARVSLNGRDLGLYVLVEGWNRDFLREHFENTKGNLYDGGFVKEVTDELSTNSGENPKDQTARLALVKAAQETDLRERKRLLEGILDVERFLKYLALDIMLWNWDGYAMNKNNWRLYHDMDTGKMVFMPHGLDQLFANPEGSIFPPMQGMVALAVLGVPEFRNRYFESLRALRKMVFDPAGVITRVQKIAASVRPVLAEFSGENVIEYDKAVANWCENITRRAASLDRQLLHPIQPLEFDNAGMAALEKWRPKTVFGAALLSEIKEATATTMLTATTTNGSSIGAWTTSLWLEQGRYSIEGKMKTRGIVADPGDPRPGIGFRTKRHRPDQFLTGDTDWQPVFFEFRVEEPLVEMELFWEFRGTSGWGWVDLQSLRLRKLPAPPAKQKHLNP